DATAAALRDGWLHTGAVARRDAGGFDYTAGRATGMIISGRENACAADGAAVPHAHPAVAEAALAGAPDAKRGEIGAAVVIARPGSRPSEDELLAFCGTRLARYTVPRRIVFVDDFPRTALGKPQKTELRRHCLRSKSVDGVVEG